MIYLVRSGLHGYDSLTSCALRFDQTPCNGRLDACVWSTGQLWLCGPVYRGPPCLLPRPPRRARDALYKRAFWEIQLAGF